MHSDTQPGFYLPNSRQRAPDYLRRPEAESAGLWSQGYLLNHVTGITIRPVLNNKYYSYSIAYVTSADAGACKRRGPGMILAGMASAGIESAGVDQPTAGLDDDGFVVGQGFDQFKTALPAQHKYARR